MTHPLPPGLVLREALPGDLDQIGALLAERGEPQDALDHRLVVTDPALGWSACAVVVDGERVVSTATLLDETVRIGGVSVPAGQVELVATDAAYEGRGLVRALMGWAHRRSADRGHLLQVMIGIPYFYRLFGYEYAIDIPPARVLLDPPATGRGLLRTATHADLPALAALQTAAQAGADVAMAHPAERARWLLEHEASTTWVLERDGAVAASARVGGADGEWLVAEAAAVDTGAADALLAALAAQGGAQGAVQGGALGGQLRVVHRAGTLTGAAWADRLGPAQEQAEQYYARIERPEALLDALAPVLHARLVAAGLAGTERDLVISTFGRHYRVALTAAGLGPTRVGGPMQSPGVARGMGVAPDQLPALLLGPLGLRGLARVRPDVYPGPDAEVYQALFPPLTADLLTYYLPW